MEQDERDSERKTNDQEAFESLTGQSFDDYLNNRLMKAEVERACRGENGRPISEEKLSPLPSVDDVVVDSSSSLDSKVTEETESPQSSPVAHVAVGDLVDKETRVTIKQHEIVGSYVSEEIVAYEVDEEAQEIYRGCMSATVDISLEEVTRRIHKLGRARELINRAQQGYRMGLEEKLHKLNQEKKYAKVKEWEAFDAEERKRWDGRRRKADGSSKVRASKTTSTVNKVRGKGMNNAKALISMGYEKAYVMKSLEDRGILDEATKNFVEESFKS